VKLSNNKGFTLIEVIVVAGIIAILAGILVPLIFKEIDESKITRAAADVKSISTAMLVLRKDTGSWPGSAACTPGVEVIMGNGIMPVFSAVPNWATSQTDTYDHYLNTDDSGCWPTTWKGPYMATVTPDPWGHAYVTNATEILANGNIWIISAGPNGTVETGSTADNLAGDDIGVRIK